MSKCEICGIAADLKCGGCKIIFYCGKDHQKRHWKNGHKSQCRCFEVKTNDQFGRYVIATRDIKAGEIILREKSIVLGPKMVSKPTCLGCNNIIELLPHELNFYKCSKCSWPLCGPSCETSSLHIDECQLMASKKYRCQIDYVDDNKMESAYCVIVPLRCLLLKQQNERSFKALMSLEDHLSDRINTPIYSVLKSNLVTFIRFVLEMNEFDETTILKVAAILDTNAFEIRPPKTKSRIRAIYSQASMFSHDCLPNTRHVFDENMQIMFVATIDIPKGSTITATYTQPLKSTIERREHLRQFKCFDCACNRCADPTEFDTYIGAITCTTCKIGKIISTEPLNNSAPWKCNICNHEISSKQVLLGNKSLQCEIENIPKNSPKSFEEFLIKYQTILHEKNTHIVQIKYALTQLYGNVPGFYLHELNKAAIERKIYLCNELLEIADQIAPGRSDFRGRLLLDLHEVIAVQSKREFDEDLMTKNNAQERLEESMCLLQEAIEILNVDPSMTEMLEKRLKTIQMEIE